MKPFREVTLAEHSGTELDRQTLRHVEAVSEPTFGAILAAHPLLPTNQIAAALFIRLEAEDVIGSTPDKAAGTMRVRDLLEKLLQENRQQTE